MFSEISFKAISSSSYVAGLNLFGSLIFLVLISLPLLIFNKVGIISTFKSGQPTSDYLLLSGHN